MDSSVVGPFRGAVISSEMATTHHSLLVRKQIYSVSHAEAKQRIINKMPRSIVPFFCMGLETSPAASMLVEADNRLLSDSEKEVEASNSKRIHQKKT